MFVALIFQEADEAFAEFVVFGVFQEGGAVARALEGDVEDVADGGCGAVGHHNDAIREEEGFVDIVGDHERGFLVASP